MNFKRGDQVLVTKGKDRKRKGKIIKVLVETGKVIVEGLNLRKKHTRPKKEGEKGEILEVPTPINIPNLKLLCPKCKKPTRIGYKVVNNKKYRYCKKCKKDFL